MQHVYRGSKLNLSKVFKKKTSPYPSSLRAEKPLWFEGKMVELTMLAKRCEEKGEVEITARKQRPERENNLS